MASAAVVAEPRLIPGWVALGQALRANGQNEEAERAYEQAIRLDGMSDLDGLGGCGCGAATDPGLGGVGPGSPGKRTERGGGARIRTGHSPGRHERSRWPRRLWLRSRD